MAMAAFFQQLEEEAEAVRSSGFAAEISEIRRAQVRKIAGSIAWGRVPAPSEPEASVPADAAPPAQRAPLARTQARLTCLRCARIFALKRTLDLHSRVCAE